MKDEERGRDGGREGGDKTENSARQTKKSLFGGLGRDKVSEGGGGVGFFWGGEGGGLVLWSWRRLLLGGGIF